MVFFTCDKCGEALKKAQVERHNFKCRYPSYSCIDCNAVFTANSYKDHVKCISEDQKYGGKNYVVKENKGEVKQNRWVEQVERAIENVRNPQVKGLLEQILGFGNIPRKEAKFINFLQNSIRIRDRNLCVQAWNCISEEAKKMTAEAAAKAEVSGSQNGTTPEAKAEVNQNSVPGEEESNGDSSTSTRKDEVKNNEENTPPSKPFKWKRAIKRALKEADDGSMKIKKLRKSVIKMWRTEGHDMDEDALKTTFEDKLKSSGVVLDGKVARLS